MADGEFRRLRVRDPRLRRLLARRLCEIRREWRAYRAAGVMLEWGEGLFWGQISAYRRAFEEVEHALRGKRVAEAARVGDRGGGGGGG